MDVITYNLMEDLAGDSQKFYENIAKFTDEILNESKPFLASSLGLYNKFLVDKGIKTLSYPQYILETLTLGVLWITYSKYAMDIKRKNRTILVKIDLLRRKSKYMKPVYNSLKGLFTEVLLANNSKIRTTNVEKNLESLDKLILWLEASGEFKTEIIRISRLKNFLSTLSKDSSEEFLKQVVTMARWYEKKSNKVLGTYTGNVQAFLDSSKGNNKYREDAMFRQRARVEYHLNMLGAEILNREYRKEFLKTSKKILLLPVCMKKYYKCSAKKSERFYTCNKCSDTCEITQLEKLGNKLGFEVLIIPHESSVSAIESHETLFEKNTGVIGVACVLKLIAGGWMLEDMGVPAQCIILDYCGCKNHWHDKGIETKINLNKLEEILDK